MTIPVEAVRVAGLDEGEILRVSIERLVIERSRPDLPPRARCQGGQGLREGGLDAARTEDVTVLLLPAVAVPDLLLDGQIPPGGLHILGTD